MSAPAPDPRIASLPLVHAIGWFEGRYGYNVHTRNLFEALSRRLPVVASPMKMLEGPQEADKAMMRALSEAGRPVVSIALIYGMLADVLDGAAGTRIAYTVWESTKLPDSWFEPLGHADRIWTATAWGKRVFIANGFDADRVDVVPEGVDPTLFNPGIPPSGFFPRDGTFRFLAVGRWEARKGIPDLVKAFDEEFGGEEFGGEEFGDTGGVELVLAGLDANQPGFDLRGELRALRLRRPERLKIIPTVRGHDTFASLYTACDAFVAPTRAEGWGLPIIEAMACGLPTITTGYSGPTEFIGEHAWRIDHRLVPVDVPFFERADGDLGLWAEPDWRHLRDLMRAVMADPEAARARGLAGSRRVLNHFSWERAAERLQDHINRIVPPAQG